MKSLRWTLLRSIAATTSFAILSTASLQGYAQDSNSATPSEHPAVEARIRIRTDADTAQSNESEYRFAPVPALPDGQQKPASRSLLDSRFSGFPTTDASQSNHQPQSSAAGTVAPVGWTAPLVTTQDEVQTLPPPPQDQVPQQQVQQIQAGDPRFGGPSEAVTINYNPLTQEVTLVGSAADVAIVEAKLKELQQSTAGDKLGAPARISLRSTVSTDIVDSVRQIFASRAATAGSAEIFPLTSPNAIIVYGGPDAISAIEEIIQTIDADVSADDARNFAPFKLKHVSAADAKRRLEEFFGTNVNNQAGGNAPGTISVVADYRSNVILVRGNAQAQQQAKLLLDAIDIDEEAAATKSVRVFRLQNAIASDLAVILQDAMNGALKNTTQPLTSAGTGGGVTAAPLGQDANEFSSEATPAKLQLQTLGKDGKIITSGLLFDVRVTPDAASNSLIVRGPASAMPLVEELINQLDLLPNAETLIKVFQIINGDAQSLLDTLESIFGAGAAAQGGAQAQTGAIANLPLQTSSSTPGAALVNLRFALDQRTNSIIATGPAGDLQVVEDLLNRLDEDLRSRRRTIVYRLSNSNVLDVEEALNNLLDSRSDVLAADPRASGGAVLADQEIVIVPEFGSNSLIISSLPENFPEIENIIKRLDRRPPMVKVKVLIAEVSLGSLEEFGVEIGIQDSLLFDRGTTLGPAGGITGGTGFDFNSSATSNLNSTFPGTLAGQALSNLGVGRTNAELGFGGLVLSAGNESINVLLRALKDRDCLRVLSRPHIMTLENVQGRVSVGQLVPRITASNQTNFGGVSNTVEERSVGVILEITPRVSPDGMITMFVDIIKSELGLESDGVPVAVDINGVAVNQAPINATEAQTTIISRSGQTVVFSGLIQESKGHAERGAPILSDLPIIGPLFKFESDEAERTELMIIMTPTLVDADEVIETQNADEMERMHWCLCDVAEIYGNTDFDPVHVDQGATRTLYPGQDEDLYWSSENRTQGEEVSQASHTSGSSTRSNVEKAGFLQKMKLEMKKSPVARIADRIRGSNASNRNDRNRSDFDELKRLRSHRQE